MGRYDHTVLPLAALGAMAGIIILLTQGCSNGPIGVETPEQRQALARKAGEAAALLWVAIDKPSDELVDGVQVVVDQTRAALSDYVEGGFAGSLPEIEKAVEGALPGDENKAKRVIAIRLAQTLLEELDHLFEKHPDWQKLSGETAGIIGAFLDGSTDGLGAYTRKIKAPPVKVAPAVEQPKAEAKPDDPGGKSAQ